MRFLTNVPVLVMWVFVGLLGLGGSVCLAEPNTIFVPDDVENIQAAIILAQDGDTIVIGNSATEFSSAIENLSSQKCIIDLVRVTKILPNSSNYEGIAW